MKTRIAFAALAVLLACGPVTAWAQEDEMPPAAWIFWQGDGQTSLLYGWPGEWETQGNYLGCDDRSGVMTASYWADHQINASDVGGAETTRLTLRSGAVEKVLEAKAVDEQMNGGVEIDATLPADDPLLAEFARTGALQMSAYADKTNMPPAPVADAQKLLTACRKPK